MEKFIRSMPYTPTTDDLYIEGLASQFDVEYQVARDYWESFDKSAFNRSLQQSGHDIKVLAQHDEDQLLGRTKSKTASVYVDSDGLYYRAKYDESDPDHQRTKAKIKRGDYAGSSIQFTPLEYEWRNKNGRKVMHIKDCILWHCGPVTEPCSPTTTAQIRSLDDSYNEWIETQKRLKIASEITT